MYSTTFAVCNVFLSLCVFDYINPSNIPSHLQHVEKKKVKMMIKSHLSSIQTELVQMWQYVKQISNIYDAVTTS